jgi:hypothetical protein
MGHIGAASGDQTSTLQNVKEALRTDSQELLLLHARKEVKSCTLSSQ